jgi:conjugative relaxase-like TrwC/TraI family protein
MPARVIKKESAKRYYYEKDPLYSGDGENNSKWIGGGCKDYGVQEGSRIRKNDYLNLIEGRDRQGIKQVQSTWTSKDGQRTDHRAGVEFPFGDPKSVSIVEHILGGEGIREVREKAIEQVVRYIDAHYIAYRETRNGKTRVVRAPGHGIFTSYAHSTSRANDPHSHTHLMVANMVRRPDGKWRALHNDMLYDHQSFIFAMYHSYMAKGLADLGYQIENKGKGEYEIAGVPREVRELFSKRSHQIKELEKQLRESGAFNNIGADEVNQIAALSSRAAKSDKTKEELMSSWESQLRIIGYRIDRENKSFVKIERAGEKDIREVISDKSAERSDSLQKAPTRIEKNYQKPSYEVDALTEDIMEVCGDGRNMKFYRRVASALPSRDIYRAIAEVREARDRGAIKRSTGALFSNLVKKYAEERGVELKEVKSKPTKPKPREEKFADKPSNREIGDKHNSMELGSSGPEIVQPGPSSKAEMPSGSSRSAIKPETVIDALVDLAVRDVTANESTFDQERILRESFHLSLGKYTPGDAEKAFQGAVLNGSIQEIAPGVFSTPEMIETEREVIQKLKAGESKCQPVMSLQEAVDFIAAHEAETGIQMTEGQKGLFLAVIAGRDQYIIAQGDAGSGKTTVFQAVTAAARSRNATVSGYSHTGKAVKEFCAVTDAPGSTIASYLASTDREPADLKVLDEASMIGSKNMLRMIEQTEKESARMVLIGDVKQLMPIEAGRAFGDSQKHAGLRVIEMRESVRQRTDYARSVVALVKDKAIDDAIEILHREGKVHEEEYDARRAETARDLFVEQPRKSVVIVSLNSERKEINNLIREDLKKSGLIDPAERKYVTREQINMLESAKRYANSYRTATHVLAQRTMKNMPAGVEARIVNIDPEENLLTLQNASGEFHVDLVKHGDRLRAFQETERQFSAGDHIVFTKNDKQLGVQNGLAGTIKRIETDGQMIVDINGRDLKFDPNKYQYIDHGYAITDYKAQGSTYENVIFCGMAEKTNYNSFYVASSRIKSDFALITNDLETFKERAVIELKKTSTLDYVLAGPEPNQMNEKLEYFKSLSESEQKRYLDEMNEKFGHFEPSRDQLLKCAAIEAYEKKMSGKDQKPELENEKNDFKFERANDPNRDMNQMKSASLER